MSSRSFNFEMKKLLDKFTKGKSVELFQNMYPQVRVDESLLMHKVLENMKILCNHVADRRNQRSSNDHLLNFRLNILSCVVPKRKIVKR